MMSRRHIAQVAAAFMSLASGRGTTDSTPSTAKKQSRILRLHARRRLQTENDLTLLDANGDIVAEAPMVADTLTEDILRDVLDNDTRYTNWETEAPFWNELIQDANDPNADLDWQTLSNHFLAIDDPGEFNPATYNSVMESMGDYDELKRAYLRTTLKDMKAKIIEDADGAYSDDQITTALDNLEKILTEDNPVLSEGEQMWLHEMSQNVSSGTVPVFSNHEELADLDQTEWRNLMDEVHSINPDIKYYDVGRESEIMYYEGLGAGWITLIIAGSVGAFALLFFCGKRACSQPTTTGT